MKTQAVKGFFAAAAAVVLVVTPLAGRSVTIDVTKFQQRYPWNGLVDIDYTITRTEGDPELDPAKNFVEITVVNCENATTNVAHVFRQGALPISNGTHRVTWDANAEGVNFKSQNVKVFAEIVHYAEKYMVIDVSGGPNTNCYPVTYMLGAPNGGFTNDTYRGNKIVLRLIPPGSFVMGSPTTEPGHANGEVQHAVAITKPFYIGVFEITQKQYLNVMGGTNPSQYKGDYRPVEGVAYNTIRGTADTGTHQYDWPWTNEVASSTFLGMLRAKCREWDSDKQAYDKEIVGIFDLPTDAQWEYACRAGKTTPLNDGVVCANINEINAHFNNLGLYEVNSGRVSADVGTRMPNAWGLYDMHGNVWEWCLDWYQEDVQNIENPSLDPVGPSAGVADNPKRVTRGGSCQNEAQHGRSAFRLNLLPSDALSIFGFRLSSSLP